MTATAASAPARVNEIATEHAAEVDALTKRLSELRPDLVVVPREPWSIMTMRGYQSYNTLEPLACASEYISIDDDVVIPGYPDQSHLMGGEDERLNLVVAGIWRGCIEGYEEWTQRCASEYGQNAKIDRYLDGWRQPVPTCAQTNDALAAPARVNQDREA